MIDQASERHPLDLIAEEFTERLRRGEEPSVDAYAARHPELAGEIHDLLPTIQEMELLKRRKERSGEPLGFPECLRLERLGDYRIIHEIGRGGMGIVYEAEQESLGRRVAIKVLPRHLVPDSKQSQRFDREARTAARLHHTNIVPVFGVGQQDGFRYYVMQYIDGVGLDEVVRELERIGGGGPGDGETEGASRGPRAARRAVEAADIARALLGGTWSEAGDPPDSSGRGNGAEDLVVPSAGAEPSAPARGEPCPSAETVVIGAAKVKLADAEEMAPEAEESASPPRPALRLGAGYWRCVAGIGLQAASGLQYAHSQGTLHRDIKPANLLLDSRGFVWVGDFGLAKTMDDHAISQTGDVVGTLRYMAPEQLSGEADERSDVYGLGLTLYELAALRPAYREPDTKRLIRAITEGQPLRPRKIRPEMPRDLETIILKSIAREPAHRYRSAGDLRADLQRFLDDIPIHARRIGAVGRVWRWSKRNRALATVGGTALALLVLLATVATVGYVETSKARDGEAETSRLAQGALDEIFDQFSPNRSAPISSLTLGESETENIEVPIPPVLSQPAAALLENLLRFYKDLAELKSGDAALRRKVADASRRVGDIRQRLGNYEEARVAYQRALGEYQALEDKSPGDAGLRIEVAKIHNELGSLARDMGESGRASQDSHEMALAILSATSPAASASPKFRFELARTHYFLSRGGWSGPGPGGPGAPQNWKGGDRRKGRRPPEADPAPAGRDGKREEPRDEKGGAPGRRGPQKEQREHLESAIRILDGLLAEDPRTPEYRLLLARAYRGMRMAAQDPQALDKAREILEKLVADYQNIPDYRYNLAKMYGDIEGMTGESDEEVSKKAIESLEKALAISEDLVADHPHVPTYAMSLVDFHQKLARILQKSRQFSAAESNLEKALEVQSTLVRRYPGVTSTMMKVTVLDLLARLLRDQHRGEEAWFYIQESLSILEPLLVEGPQTPQQGGVRFLLSRQLSTLSEVLLDLGDEAGAAEAWERAEALGARPGRPGGPGGRGRGGEAPAGSGPANRG